jgi:hypothetical protein
MHVRNKQSYPEASSFFNHPMLDKNTNGREQVVDIQLLTELKRPVMHRVKV